jgi:hypothetical protein
VGHPSEAGAAEGDMVFALLYWPETEIIIKNTRKRPDIIAIYY